jgi:hypothetical protein
LLSSTTHGEGVRMFDGYLALLPIQGGIVAAVLLAIAIFKVVRGVHGSEAFTWNTIGIICFLYLFTSAAWLAFGGARV